MADASTIIEGAIKYRDGKKWKPRWCIVRKLSPVADCLHLQLYRECKDRGKLGPTKASLSLEGFLGVESAFTLDKESNTLAIICKDLVVVIAFESRELLIEWQVKIHTNLGEDQQFSVELAHVPPKSRTPLGPSHLHIIDGSFCLTSGHPPRLLGNWLLAELRRYGVVSGKFCFEGGSRCGRGEGLHVLISNQPEQISSAYDLASQGKLNITRRPFVRKNSFIGNAAHRTPTKEHWASTTTVCSTESSRPLLNSSESSSTCDGSAEASPLPLPLSLPIRPNEGIVGPAAICDDQKENYRWPSQGSNDGKMSVTSADLDSVDTLSIAISDIPENVGCGMGGMTPSWVGGCNEGHRRDPFVQDGNLALEHCAYCNECINSAHCATSASGFATNGSVLSPSWTNDMRRFQHAKSNFGHEQTSNGAKHDSMSVSSHGSTSSSGSGGTNISEYAMPRVLAESLYDKPRNILPHVCCFVNGQMASVDLQSSCRMEHPPLNKECTSQNSHPTFQIPQRCSCLDDSKNIPSVHQAAASMTLPHPLKTHISNGFSTAATSSTISHSKPLSSRRHLPGESLGCPCHSNSVRMNCHSPATSPSRKQGARTVDKFDPALGIIHASSCLCQSNHSVAGHINPYGNYDVPRSVLCPSVQSKENFPSVRMVSLQGTENYRTNRSSMISSDGSDYDVPRRIKECLHTGQFAMHTSSNDIKAFGQHEVSGSGSMHSFHGCESHSVPGKSELQEPVMPSCACQRVMHWAENLLVCRRQKGFPEDKLDFVATNNALSTPQQVLQGSEAHCSFHHHLNCDTTMQHVVEAKLGSDGGSVVQIIQHCTCTHIHSLPQLKMNAMSSLLPNEAANCLREKTCSSVTLNRNLPTAYANDGHVQLSELQCDTKISANGTPVSASCQKHCTMDSSNYANLEFIKSLEMYENAATVLAKLDQMEQKERSTGAPEAVIYTQPDPVSDNANLRYVYHCSHHNNSFPNRAPHPNPTLQDLKDFSHPTAGCCTNSSPKTVEFDSNNYLMMQPCSEMQAPKLPVNAANSHPARCPLVDHRKESLESTVVRCAELPFRPFMPLALSKTLEAEGEQSDLCNDVEIEESRKIDSAVSTMKYCNVGELRTTRSNSVVEFKRRVFLRKRSSSADSRREKLHSSSLDAIHCSCCDPARMHSKTIGCVGSAEEWPSAEDIAKAIDERIDSEPTVKDATNESVIDDEERKLCIPVASGVKRSSVVPCKSGNRDSASSSDSGVSTGSPKQSMGNAGSGEEAVKHYAEMDVSNEIPEQLLAQLCSVDSKSTTSSTMSDMSDYIETLSLSSHGSGDSQDLYRPHGSATNTLRPRSCKEYQKVDRNTLSELSSSLSLMSTTNGGRVVTMDCSGGVSQMAHRSRCQPSVASSTSSSTCASPTKLSSQPIANVTGSSPMRIPIQENLEKKT